MKKLTCTTEQYDSLYEALNESRKSSEFIKVPRAAFANLLVDHSELQTLHGHKFPT